MLELLRFGLIEKYDFSQSFMLIGYLAVIITGYLLGSLNFGIIISRLAFGEDIRNYGSGGSGMTNMLRTYGKPAAAATFILDGAKAVIAAFIGKIVFGSDAILSVPTYAGAYFGGLAAILGHAFPVYYKFKGGRGVASVFFMVLVTAPVVALICMAMFIIIVAWTKYISLGSVMCVIIYPLILNRLTGSGMHNLIAIIIMLLIIYFHRGNIMRLSKGEENKLNLRKTEKKEIEKKE